MTGVPRETDPPRRGQKVIRVPIYWLVVGACMMLVSPILAILVSVQVNQRTIAENERDRQRTEQKVEAARQQVREETIVRYCRLFGSQVDVYQDATTRVGRKAYDTWLTEYNAMGCVPPR